MWQGIEGHDAIVERFRQSLARGRLASTFLFVGPPGVGKRRFARALAKALLCQTNDEENLDPCGRCDACRQVEAGTHPDLIVIAKPADKTEIPVAAFIGDKEERMRAGLCHDISLRPFMGGRKVAIIDDADALNEEGANCLLKTLEEPPPRSVMILIGTSADRQLPTIRSRAQIIRFQPLETQSIARILQAELGIADPAEAQRLAQLSEGSVERAMAFADPELVKFRAQFLDALARPNFDSVGTAKPVLSFIDEAGKDAPARRDRTRQLAAIAAEFYRHTMRAAAGLPLDADDALRSAVQRAVQAGLTDGETLAAHAERCLEAIAQVDRNANQATLVEAWMDDLR